MEKFRDLIEKINQHYERMQGARYERDMMLKKLRQLHASARIDDELMQAISEKETALYTLQLEHELMRHNAKIALFHDVMPVAVEVWQKYAGKAYGPKTESKIMCEIQQQTGARVCVVTRYNQEEITISPNGLHGYSITCGLCMASDKNDRLRLLVGNKITPQPLEAFGIWYEKTTYFDDIPAAVEQIKKLYADVVEKKRELEHACSLFNTYAVEGIESVYRHTNIYDQINVH